MLVSEKYRFSRRVWEKRRTASDNQSTFVDLYSSAPYNSLIHESTTTNVSHGERDEIDR